MYKNTLLIIILFLTATFAGADDLVTCSEIVPMRNRYDKISITDFGGVGDGKTVNTKAFREAIYRIEHLGRIGGSLLYIPPGVYLTERFNLTSHMTLYLASGAVIKATQLKVADCNVVVRYVTILAPPDSPNTDGVDPDSSSNVCIEDMYISNGDDMIAIKSGWDEYGLAFGRRSSDITIRRITGSSPFAGIAIGSEMSGGVENVLAEHINLFNMGVGIHLKTNIGRGGYIRNITLSNVYIENARKGIKIAGDVGDHPDDKFDPKALPVIRDIKMKSIWGEKILQPGLVKGIKNAPFINICLSDINLNGPYKARTRPWECSDVKGSSLKVSPWPCSELIGSLDGTCFTHM
uniref:Uncharacterized protein n=1 Tax=Chenopodium quinoa TaxID=63459 RepID=A0A803LWH6_CHEQI